WEEHDEERVVSPVLGPLRERLVGDLRPAAVALGLAVALVLLIACGNVAAILLARSFARRRELALREALGASSRRLARQLLTESLALSLAAAPLGLLLGFWSIRLLTRAAGDQLPSWIQVGVDWRLGLFAVAAVVLTAVLFGWAPVLQARRQRIPETLAEGSGRTGASRAQRRTMGGLVVAEVALAALLLVTSGLLIRGFQRLQHVDPGFRTEDVLTFRVSLPSTSYPDSVARRGFYRELLEALGTLPGVHAAGLVTCPPLGCHSGYFFEVEGAPPRGHGDPNPVVLYRGATPGYFRAMGVRLARGRFFDGGDDGVLGIIVNETFARELIPAGRDPVGQRVRFHGGEGPWFTVIGVAADVRHYGLERPMRPGVYFPLEARAPASAVVALWTGVPPTGLVAPARALVRGLDPELPLYQVGTMEEALSASLQMRRISSWLMAVFAGLALVLALGGIYGVLSYIVGQRGREIAVRLALGAPRGQVARMVVRQGMGLAVAGLGLGLLAALAAGRLLSGLLVGLSPRDPLTFGVVAALLLGAAALATLAPARRALGMEPQAALRED
ncbi:MAG TPA: FtsX-like permease family protein, partial [Longimicrobiales bacterium]|nr:FtsX-like permease family protein [Longimicrobiales bacterium]